jgi:hypothetical protein
MMKTFDETTPLEDILKALPQNEIDELSALGDTRDDTRWKIGDSSRRWIDDNKMPVNQTCKIIGKLTDYGVERVRQILYNARFYNEHPELRQHYLNLRYSIFEYARTCDDPAAVLQSAQDGNLTPQQVKFTWLPLWDTLKEVFTRIPKAHEAEAQSIIKTALAKLRELAER